MPETLWCTSTKEVQPKPSGDRKYTLGTQGYQGVAE